MCALCRAELHDNSVFSAPFNCVISTKENVLHNSLKSKLLIISKFDQLLTWLGSFLKDERFRNSSIV
jgi:hypothetical protein